MREGVVDVKVKSRPDPRNLRLIVFVQESDTGEVVGVLMLSVPVTFQPAGHTAGRSSEWRCAVIEMDGRRLPRREQFGYLHADRGVRATRALHVRY